MTQQIGNFDNMLVIHKSLIGFDCNFFKIILKNPDDSWGCRIKKKLEDYSDGVYSMWELPIGFLLFDNSWRSEIRPSTIVMRT